MASHITSGNEKFSGRGRCTFLVSFSDTGAVATAVAVRSGTGAGQVMDVKLKNLNKTVLEFENES